MTFAAIIAAGLQAAMSSHVSASTGLVTLVRVPNGGIQPEAALDRDGVLHLLYFAGEARAGDLFYVRSRDYGSTWSAPVRVNSEPGSAIATGTIRGGQLAVGGGGRVYVTWNGSDTTTLKAPVNPANGQRGMPFLFSRSNRQATAFEPQRSLTRRTYSVDGGGSVAATSDGNVFAAWHALPAGGADGKENRRVWLARSHDEGATFSIEEPASRDATGVCGCCALRLFADPSDTLYLLYRSATSLTHRDIYLLTSTNRGESFRGSKVHEWEVAACPMSSMSFAAAGTHVWAAWETAGQAYAGVINAQTAAIPTAAPAAGGGGTRKHPRLATNAQGQVLFVWTEGTAWARGGSLAWQILDPSRHPTGHHGSVPGLRPWSFAAAVGRPDSGFVVVY